MRNTIQSSAFLVSITIATFSSGAAYSDSETKCEDFEVTAPGAGRIVSYHSLGDSGSQAGDIRPGLRNLVNQNDEVIGQLRWYETMIGPTGDEHADTVSVVRYYMLLPDGTILAETLNVANKDRLDTSRPPLEFDQLIILGGTGAYAGVRGTMSQKIGSEADPLQVTYSISFVC